MSNKQYLKEVTLTFENDDLKELCKEVLKTIPDYFYNVAASSTGKYHPSYALGDGGLVRHTTALCKIMNSIFEVTPYFDSRERDLLRIAGIMHDSRKSGDQDAYARNKYTNFDHPIQAAEVIRSFKGKNWNDDEIEIIAVAIESHMGQWNTDRRSSVILPTPENKYQYMLHVCDYLASRKFLEVKFDTTIVPKNPLELTMPFGKHSGKQLKDVPVDYLEWAYANMDSLQEPLKSAIGEIIKKN